jgi:hypothetical protein
LFRALVFLSSENGAPVESQGEGIFVFNARLLLLSCLGHLVLWYWQRVRFVFHRTFLLLLSFFSTVLGSTCFAENDPVEPTLSSQSIVQIRVFAIEASKGGVSNLVPHTQEVAFANGRTKAQIGFLSPKLNSLPYTTYSLLSEQTFKVPLKKRMQFSLAKGHHITLRPLSADDDRVCFWLKWVEGDGIDIVDTRLTVNVGEPMVTVWEHDESNGFVVAVEVTKP